VRLARAGGTGIGREGTGPEDMSWGGRQTKKVESWRRRGGLRGWGIWGGGGGSRESEGRRD